MSSQTYLPQRDENNDSPEWREEVADRLKAHRARRRYTAASTLALNFEAGEEQFPREELKRVRAERRDAARMQTTVEAVDVAVPSVAQENVPCHAGETAIEQLSGSKTVEAESPSIYEESESIPPLSNIIEFPRLIVADRPMQAPAEPEASDEDLADSLAMQLRIFDADMSATHIAPTRWAGMHLDEDRSHKHEISSEFELPLQIAPLAKRATCMAMDGLVVLLACVVFGVSTILTAKVFPEGRDFAVILLVVPVLLWSIYQCVFFLFGKATLGMEYARLGLCNFQDGYATRGERLGRAFASILSLVSLGMGYLWVFADEDALGWHDRMTRTYFRELAGSSHDEPEA